MFKKLLGVGGVVFIVAFVAAFFLSPQVKAAGETYTWLDYSTIGARDGGYLSSVGGEPGKYLSFIQDKDDPALFVAEPNIDNACRGTLSLRLSPSDNTKGIITAQSCDIIADISSTVTISGEVKINTEVNNESLLLKHYFLLESCTGLADSEYKSCKESTDVRHTDVAALCQSFYDFTQQTYLANRYLDCIASELGVDRPSSELPEEEEESATGCAIKNIGWMVCQVLQFVAWITDRAFDLLSMFLEIDPLKQYVDVETATGASQADSPLYSAWKVALSFANILFVFVFLFIIFSYLTNQGLSNYNIKTLGPRLIIASLLVNLSFFISGVAVDLSNVLGGTIRTTLVDITPPSTRTTYTSWSDLTKSIVSITPTDQAYNDKNNPNASDEEDPDTTATPSEPDEDPAIMPVATTAMLTGITLTGGAVLVANLSVLIPFMAAVLAALITVLLLLMIRQAIIICLIMISPIAFALILLPNTRQWFDKWADIFTKFLLLYPAISLVFGASYLASSVVGAQAADNSQSFIAMFALGIQLIPLFITPLILKLSGGLLDRFAGIVNNPNKGPLDRMRNSAREFRQDRKTLQRGRSVAKPYTTDLNKGKFRNGAGRLLRFAQTKNPNAMLQRRKMESDAAAGAAESLLNETKGLAFNDKEAFEAAAKGIKDPEFYDSLIEESLAYAAKDLSDVEAGQLKAKVAQYDERGIGSQEALMRAQTGKWDDGTELTEIEQAAMMQKAANAATADQAYQLIANSGNQKSSLVRRTLADTLRKNGFSKENAHFGGAAIGSIAEGGFGSEADIDNLMIGAVRGSKYGVNTLANQSPYVLSRLKKIAERTDPSEGPLMPPELREKLRKTARDSLATQTASTAIKGGEARTHIEDLAR